DRVIDLVYNNYMFLNDAALDVNPLLLSFLSAAAGGYIVHLIYVQRITTRSILDRLFATFCFYVKRLPIIRGLIQESMDTADQSIKVMIHKNDSSRDWLTTLPAGPMSRQDILLRSVQYDNRENSGLYAREKPDFLNGRVSGAVFNLEQDLEELRTYKGLFGQYAFSNPLWPQCFPGLRRMEAEVTKMVITMLNGGPECSGTMTAGGSMSIHQAILAYRNRAIKKGILFPEIILPSSAHIAFFKAAEMFGLAIRQIAVPEDTFVVRPADVKAAINSNTACIVGSAPNYPFGTVDPIEELGQIGLKYDVPLHVDACCGGFLIPFFADEQVPFDFRVPGVSSISADTHKYGLAPKGSSVIAFASKELRRFTYFTGANWQGGIYASPTIEGSRNGSAIAVTWGAMLYHGEDAYKNSAEAVRATTRAIREGIRGMEGMQLMGEGDICIVAWRNSIVDDYALSELMERRGFVLSPLQFPKGCHLMVTPMHTKGDFVGTFLAAMEKAIADLKKNPKSVTGGTCAFYGGTVNLPDRDIVKDLASIYLDNVYEFPPETSR
ncbi:hypothetical protein PFISCL1PPCAC_27816, partial [Pristionchus fissidentatus]